MAMTTILQELEQRQVFFDQFCAAWSSEYRQKGVIHCGRGCSGCCSLVVNCTFPEALRVAAVLDQKQQQRLQEHAVMLRKIAGRADNLKDWLGGYRREVGGCPFLDCDGGCGVYQVRPLSCRSLLSTKEPVWCSTDFAALDISERNAFLDSLDRSAVSFPSHYAATPQEVGQELEMVTLDDMKTVYGFSMLGSLGWLVWLELEYGLSRRLNDEGGELQAYLLEQRLMNPYLLLID